MDSTEGILAIAGIALGLLALIVAGICLVRLRGVRRAQATVLGESGTEDLVAHAATLQSEFGALRAGVEESAARLDARVQAAEDRLQGALAYSALVRYDAYNEMSGRQSTSIALLDSNRSGIVLSSIHHRDQARMYVKQVTGGRGELELSPEESQAVELALAGG